MTFPGYIGDPVKAWLLLPHESVPGSAFIVEFVGYGGGRGDPFDWLAGACAGHPHLVMDTRGQGGGWRSADTPGPERHRGAERLGLLTRGIADPRTYYYTRLFIDAARRWRWPSGIRPAPGRPIASTRGSQGGGLAIAAAHLAGGEAARCPSASPAPRRA